MQADTYGHDDPPIRHPRQAWLAPLAGFGGMLVVSFLTSGITRDSNLGRGGTIVLASLPSLAFLAAVVFGYVKSIQCLRHRRAPGHGIAGLLSNSFAVLLVVGVIYVAFDAAGRARETVRQAAATPEAQVQAIADSLRPELPIEVDEATVVVNVSVVQPTQLTMTYEISMMSIAEFMDGRLITILEESVRESVMDNPIMVELAGSGASVRYLYRHEDGTRLGEFTITP
ncbi:MAG: hypothetical protein AAGH92_04600 [Planctomycetota bacterium]